MGQKEDGGYYFPGTDDPQPVPSCADWITVSPSELTLEPAEAAFIWCSLEVPRTARAGGRYAGVVCRLVPERGAEEPGRAQMELQLNSATVVFLTIAGRRPTWKAKLSRLEIKPAEEGGFWFEGALTNTGNVHVFGQGRLVLRGERGRRLAQTQLGGGRGTVLPGATVNFRTLITERIPIGKYIAEARVDYGGRGPAVARTPFEVGREMVMGSVSAGLAVAMEPDRQTLDIPPGGMRVAKATIFNQEALPVHVKMHVARLVQDSLGQLSPAEADETAALSAEPWVSLKLDEFDLRSGGRRTVPVSISVPEEAEAGGRFATVVAEVTAGEGPVPEANAVVFTSLLLRVLGEIAPRVEVTRVELLPPIPGLPPTFRAWVRNHGDVDVPLLSSILTVNARGEDGAAVPSASSRRVVATLSDEILLPGVERALTMQLDQPLEPGAYTAEMGVGYGPKEPASKGLDFEVAENEPSRAASGSERRS
ncbi:MAG: hypothetical protein JSV79_07975 [Armatimonadota bacterium]|nr:MAG: hypothetical protein JSV79_07975 [Armatimonadota bacterium]